MLQFSSKYLVATCFFTFTLFGGVIEHEKKIQNISDVKTYINTFKEIINESIQAADINSLEKARGSIEFIFSSLEIEESTSNLIKLKDISWNLYPTFVKTYSILHGAAGEYSETFARDGFCQGIVCEDLNLRFLETFQEVKTIPFIYEDFDPNYDYTLLDTNTEESLNKIHTYVMLEDRQLDALKPILLSLKDQITECIGTPWRVSNIRAWKTSPTTEEYGPNAWHGDGLFPSVLKIMYYPLETSYEKGTIELQVSSGIYALKEGPGAWILFKNSEILHKGVSPQIGERIGVEITILPALSHDLMPISAGQNVRHPTIAWRKQFVSKHPLYKSGEIVGVNIGGGPHWSCQGWVNLEEVISSANPCPFYLFPNCRFPIESEGVKNVYTSHAIEHLNIPTVYRIFSESHRVLETGGNFIIKIPDYDKALDCWRRQDSSFFGPGWNIESVSHLWKSRNICDCPEHRAAMIFCSFFNDAHGNPFGQGTALVSNLMQDEPYFGPPVVSIDFLRDLIQNRSPFESAKELRKQIGLKETNFHYCHQTAWSREELKATLDVFGFDVISFDPNLIMETFSSISEICEMKDISTFCWAKKRCYTQTSDK